MNNWTMEALVLGTAGDYPSPGLFSTSALSLSLSPLWIGILYTHNDSLYFLMRASDHLEAFCLPFAFGLFITCD